MLWLVVFTQTVGNFSSSRRSKSNFQNVELSVHRIVKFNILLNQFCLNIWSYTWNETVFDVLMLKRITSRIGLMCSELKNMLCYVPEGSLYGAYG